MTHRVSPDDRLFVAQLEASTLAPPQFDHRAHVRAAYVYLAESDPETATTRMRAALLAFLQHHGIPASKYHATITQAWILAVRHFMALTPDADSADAFLEVNPQLLDSKIMLSHYSASLLFSAEARAEFMEPDQGPLPRYD
ncbi:MAG: hypothetical protein WD801_12835 [Gemmatimonadaceae bacterium]